MPQVVIYKMEAKVKRRYPNYKLKGAFSGASGFKKDTGIQTSAKKLKRVLSSVPAYALHQPRRLNFPRRTIFVPGMHVQYAADLKDIQSESGYNNKKRFILALIDCFSKKAWLEAIPNKTAIVVKNAFDRIFKRTGGIPRKITVDSGTEFKNSILKEYLTKKGITLFSVTSEIKASIIERFLRTIFSKIQRYLTHNKTRKFVDKLQYFENLYNNSYHRSIRMSPNQVTLANQDQVYENLYGNLKLVDYKPPRFKIGDSVLVARRKTVFEKGYKQNYLKEIFKITKTIHTIPRVYTVEDKSGRPVRETFYEEQLQKVV